MDELYDEVCASPEERGKIVVDQANKGKSKAKMGLKKFKEVEIKSS